MNKDLVNKIKTRTQLAEVFKVYYRTIGVWIKKGLPVEPDGQFDLEKCKDWVNKNTTKPIAIPESAKQLKKDLEEHMNIIEWYKANYADILKKKQIDGWAFIEEAESLIRERMPSMANKDLVWLRDTLYRSFGITYDKERLERGESTENIAILYQRAQKLKRDKLERETG